MNDQIEQIVEPEIAEEMEYAEPCERQHCPRQVFPDALVDVQVGDVEVQWCFSCAREEFGLESLPTQETKFMAVVTAKNVALFLSWMLTFALLLLLV